MQAEKSKHQMRHIKIYLVCIGDCVFVEPQLFSWVELDDLLGSSFFFQKLFCSGVAVDRKVHSSVLLIFRHQLA